MLLHRRLLGDQRVEVGVRLRERKGNLLEARQEITQQADAVLDVPAHVLFRIELWLLLEQPCGRARREFRMAGRRFLASRHDPEEGRFAAPLGPSTPIFAPGRNASVMSSSTLRSAP